MKLKEVELTEDMQKELQDKLDAWKANERKAVEQTYTEKYEQLEAQLKEDYEELVAEIKENMKKVYTKRFTKALKEMYEEIKAEVMMESLNSPESKALEEIKVIVWPLINEATTKRHKEEFVKLAEMYESILEDHELLKGEIKKAQLVESLSPDVRKVVTKLLGEGSETEIVDKFAEIKKALKEEASSVDTSDTEDEDEEEEVEDTSKKEEEIVVRREVKEEDDTKKVIAEDNSEFKKILEEQLFLAGVKKQ
jgi:hypothetical protein